VILNRVFSRKFSSLLVRFSDHRITRSPDHPILITTNPRSSALLTVDFLFSGAEFISIFPLSVLSGLFSVFGLVLLFVFIPKAFLRVSVVE
jgi:hypothetical protein